jgi:phosphohistidine phosphatase
MALYLVQHGKSYAREVDPGRGLTPEGRTEVALMADRIAVHSVPVRAIFHSGKKRALETAEVFAEKLGHGISLERLDGMDPGDDVIKFSDRLDPEKNEMYVGHLPFMEKLVSYLVGCSADATVFKFQNGGTVCLDRLPGSGSWVIRWSLMPHLT